MSDYDYCKKHNTSFLMPELLMCPTCAYEALQRGEVKEPIGDALIEYIALIKAENDNLLSILRDYPKGQDDGTWYRRKDKILT